MALDITGLGLNAAALVRLQQALLAQEEAEAERQRAEARKLELANDPLTQATRLAQAEMFANRRDVRAMTEPEELDFLNAGPLRGGIEGVAPMRGAPLRAPLGPPAGMGGIERGITAPSFTRDVFAVPIVRGGKPRITEGQSATARRRVEPMPIVEDTLQYTQPSGAPGDIELRRRPVPALQGVTAEEQPRLGPAVRSRTAFTDRDMPMTALRMEAERARDPNLPLALAAEEAYARLHPQVLAAEAYARGRGATTSRSAADVAEQQFIDTNLPVLTGLAKTLNQVGGPAGRAIGAFRKYVTGPLALNEEAREFNRIREPLSLVLASRFNGGRPTEPDRVASAKILMDLGDSPQLTDHLSKRIYEALADPSIRTITNPVTGEVYRIRSGAASTESLGETGAPRPGTRRWIKGEWAIWDGQGWAPE